MGLQAVLFDLDGTLLDSALDFHAIINEMRGAHHLPAITAGPLRSVVSDGARAMLQHSFADYPDADLNTLLDNFLLRYQQQPCRYSRLFADIPELLAQLTQIAIPWGVVTNKPVHFCQPIMQQLQLTQHCRVLICPEHVRTPKPAPDALLLACQQLNAAPEQCLYVGDHQRDIAAGKAAGMMTVGALYGYINGQDNPANWHADYYINHPFELCPLVHKLL